MHSDEEDREALQTPRTVAPDHPRLRVGLVQADVHDDVDAVANVGRDGLPQPAVQRNNELLESRTFASRPQSDPGPQCFGQLRHGCVHT